MLLKHLKCLRDIKGDISIILIDDMMKAKYKNIKHPWILSTKDAINTWSDAIDWMNFSESNINDAISFYKQFIGSHCMNNSQARMLEFACKGLSIGNIASEMKLSPKTVYSNLQKVSRSFEQRSLPHLLSFIARNKLWPLNS